MPGGVQESAVCREERGTRLPLPPAPSTRARVQPRLFRFDPWALADQHRYTRHMSSAHLAGAKCSAARLLPVLPVLQCLAPCCADKAAGAGHRSSGRLAVEPPPPLQL